MREAFTTMGDSVGAKASSIGLHCKDQFVTIDCICNTIVTKRLIMSICDRCTDPGHCCRRLKLYGNDFEVPYAYDEASAAEEIILMDELEYRNFGFRIPFVPYTQIDGVVLFMCPKLGNDGRCTDYENRPRICREYQPATGDDLCVMPKGSVDG